MSKSYLVVAFKRKVIFEEIQQILSGEFKFMAELKKELGMPQEPWMKSTGHIVENDENWHAFILVSTPSEISERKNDKSSLPTRYIDSYTTAIVEFDKSMPDMENIIFNRNKFIEHAKNIYVSNFTVHPENIPDDFTVSDQFTRHEIPKVNVAAKYANSNVPATYFYENNSALAKPKEDLKSKPKEKSSCQIS